MKCPEWPRILIALTCSTRSKYLFSFLLPNSQINGIFTIHEMNGWLQRCFMHVALLATGHSFPVIAFAFFHLMFSIHARRRTASKREWKQANKQINETLSCFVSLRKTHNCDRLEVRSVSYHVFRSALKTKPRGFIRRLFSWCFNL